MATSGAAAAGRLDTVLEARKLYLDPDLTLSRLARVLQVPVKQLSAAINQSTGTMSPGMSTATGFERPIALWKEERA